MKILTAPLKLKTSRSSDVYTLALIFLHPFTLLNVSTHTHGLAYHPSPFFA